jgi:L,D-transpeptidase catalytic domain
LPEGEVIIETMRLAMLTTAFIAALGVAPRAGVSMEAVATQLADSPGGPGRQVLDAAIDAYDRARRLGVISNPDLLTVIDYTRPSIEPRLWVLDLRSRQILYRELVAHGRGSGDNIATTFSNLPETHMSSLGLFVTDETYRGKHGYSLRLRGLDAGVNDNAFARSLVIHGAAYVSSEIGKRLGRLGRSWGCPAVRPGVAGPLIDAIKGGTVVYAYGQTPIG